MHRAQATVNARASDRDAAPKASLTVASTVVFLKDKVTGGPKSRTDARHLSARAIAGIPHGPLILLRAQDSMRLAVEKFGDADIQRESQPLNIVQRDAVLCILDLADLVLGKFGGVRQILLAHIPRKPQAAHVLRQDASRCMNVPPCHLHGRPPD